MLFGNREPRSLVARRRGAFHPRGEHLEARQLLAIDIGGALPPNLPNVATVPYGVDLGGAQSAGGAGFSVSDVGDVNGDGFDDYVIGGPTAINTSGVISKGVGNNSRAYLVFGSSAVGGGNVDWLTLNKIGQRVGDLGQLGNAAIGQQNPITGVAGFAYDGITFFASQQPPGAQLGASVTPLGDVNGDGFADFMIGAPGAFDSSNSSNPGTGRAYLVYGGPNIQKVPNKTIDLDNTLQNPGVNIVTFVNSIPGAHTGAAVAGGGLGVTSDVITDGLSDLAIGAPNASLGGQSNNGAVYLIDGSAVRTAATTTINLSTVGQTGGTAGVIFSGAASGDQIGAALAFPGNVDGAVAGSLPIGDLLIGAPASNGGAGAAYLIYGATNLAAEGAVIGGVNQISLSRVGNPNATNAPTNTVAGAIFLGASSAAQTGFAVSTAGDFNNDGRADFLIGSPGFNGRGEATLFYGQPVSSATRIVGTIPLNAIPVTFPAANFVGANTSDLAGYSLAPLGKINASSSVNSEILIGAPGFNSNAGTVYLIQGLVPGSSNLVGSFSLANAEAQPLAGLQITLSASSAITPTFLGASVGGRLLTTPRTADTDNLADPILGAPGYAVTLSRGLDGGAFILEGHFLPSLPTPQNTGVTVQIGVNSATGQPNTVNLTQTTPLNIFIFSSTSPAFNAPTDIDPATITINGVAIPAADVTITPDPITETNGTNPVAILAISPRSVLQPILTNGTITLTISGRTLATSANAGKTFTGSQTVVVSGATGGVVTPPGQIVATNPLPVGTITPSRFVPLVALSRFNYKAIPLRVAVAQFQPASGFKQRIDQYFFPKKHEHQFGSKYQNAGHGISTLGRGVFTRGKFKPGKTIKFTHKVPVVPVNRQTEVYVPTPAFPPKPPGKQFTGSHTVVVSGATGGTTGGSGRQIVATNSLRVGTITPSSFVPHAALSRFNYKAIPLRVAVAQHQPAPGFKSRIDQYFFPKKFEHQFGSKYQNAGHGISTLGRGVFTRGKFKPGKTVKFTHKVPVVPVNRQTEVYVPTPTPAYPPKPPVQP